MAVEGIEEDNGKYEMYDGYDFLRGMVFVVFPTFEKLLDSTLGVKIKETKIISKYLPKTENRPAEERHVVIAEGSNDKFFLLKQGKGGYLFIGVSDSYEIAKEEANDLLEEDGGWSIDRKSDGSAWD